MDTEQYQGYGLLMTILIEAISIVIRCDSLERLDPGILDHFYSSIPNQTYYSDGSLARVGFMDEQDALCFISVLESLGLVHLKNGECIDIAIVLQRQSDPSPCKWLEKHEINYQGTLLDVAAFIDREGNVHRGMDPGDFAAPDGWTIEDAITYHQSRDDLTYLKSQNQDGGGMIDYYRCANGEIICIGRQERWFDLPFLCLLRMPLRFCTMTCSLGAAVGKISIASETGWATGALLGGLLVLVICSQHAKEFPMTPLWIKRILGG